MPAHLEVAIQRDEAAELSESRGALEWEISAADMAEIDAMLARQRCLAVPPAG